jgi:hypothetical protein
MAVPLALLPEKPILRPFHQQLQCLLPTASPDQLDLHLAAPAMSDWQTMS